MYSFFLFFFEMPLHEQPKQIDWNEEIIDPNKIKEMECSGKCDKMQNDFTGFYNPETHPLFGFYCFFASSEEGSFDCYNVKDSSDVRPCRSSHEHHNEKGDGQQCPLVQQFREFIQRYLPKAES